MQLMTFGMTLVYLTHSVKQKRTNSIMTNSCTQFQGSTLVMLRIKSYDPSTYITMLVFPSVLKECPGDIDPQPSKINAVRSYETPGNTNPVTKLNNP
jgi:hypothetical protein